MSNLCQYKDILGEPRKGVHSIRIFDFAAIDILLTMFAAIIISFFISSPFAATSKSISVGLTSYIIFVILIFIILVLLGIFLHWLFCVDTKLNKLLGLV